MEGVAREPDGAGPVLYALDSGPGARRLLTFDRDALYEAACYGLECLTGPQDIASLPQNFFALHQPGYFI